MSLLTDISYCNTFGGTYTERFKVLKTSPYLAVSRCLFCGDSQKNRNKARGYFYQKDQRINFRCHNCGVSTTFSKVLSTFAPATYEEYKLEVFKDSSINVGQLVAHGAAIAPPFTPEIDKWAKRRIDNFSIFKNTKKISQLSHDHPAKIYVTERLIPSRQHWRIYYVNRFFEWSNSIIPGKFNEKALKIDEPRIVLPFIDENGYCFGWTGRSINTHTSLRYATVILDESKTKVFGLDQINKSKDILVTEGPLDSLFFSNAIAMAGADLNLENITDKEKLIVVMDNQSRNKEVVDRVGKLVYNDYRVCIWPDWFHHKDINDAILAGYTPKDLRQLIIENTHMGLAAQMAFSNWKKI
jgi:hypothetical protein